MIDYYKIGKVKINITSVADSVNRIKRCILEKRKGYVCISNMRTVVVGNTEPKYQQVMENSLFNTPDGTPLVWCAKAWGLKQVERTCGPHVFDAMLEDKDPELKHFFLGDTDETLAKLKAKCEKDYGTQVMGMYSPPFAPLEEYDLEGLAKMINESGANIVWTSLRAPKQDYLAAILAPYLNDGIVMVGVGAAFRFILGEYKAPEGFLQKIGLAGLGAIRNTTVWTEIKWYIKHSIYLSYFLCSIICKRIIGRKYWE